MKSFKLKKKLLPLDKIQLLLRKYLQECRSDLNMNQIDLSQATGFSKSMIETMESATKIHPIVNRLSEFQRLADLRGIDADILISLLMGRRNENEGSSPFFKKFAKLVNEHMPPEEQEVLFSILKQNKYSAGLSEVIKNFAASSDQAKRVYLKLKYLDERGFDILEQQLDWIFGEDRDDE